MVFGIKIDSSKKALKQVNDCLSRYGSAIMFREHSLNFYFDNYFSALKVANTLKKNGHGMRTYNVFKVSKEELKHIKKENIVSSSEEYFKRSEEEYEKSVQKLKELRKENVIEK